MTERPDPLQLPETAGNDAAIRRAYVNGIAAGVTLGRQGHVRAFRAAIAVLLAFVLGFVTANAIAAPLPAPVIPAASYMGASSEPDLGRTGAPSATPGRPSPFRPSEPVGTATPAPRASAGTAAPEGPSRTGVIAWAGESFGPDYLAIPLGPGWRVWICGPAGCQELVSTDAGPNKAMLDAGRIADLAVERWEAIAGVDRSRGLVVGTWTVVGP